MKYLYHISQDINTGYDTYSDAVVCALNAEMARDIHPANKKGVNRIWYDRMDGEGLGEADWYDADELFRPIPDTNAGCCGSWCNPKDVKAVKIGVANEDIELNTVVCASFHAG